MRTRVHLRTPQPSLRPSRSPAPGPGGRPPQKGPGPRGHGADSGVPKQGARRSSPSGGAHEEGTGAGEGQPPHGPGLVWASVSHAGEERGLPTQTGPGHSHSHSARQVGRRGSPPSRYKGLTQSLTGQKATRVPSHRHLLGQEPRGADCQAEAEESQGARAPSPSPPGARPGQGGRGGGCSLPRAETGASSPRTTPRRTQPGPRDRPAPEGAPLRGRATTLRGREASSGSAARHGSPNQERKGN